MKVDQDPSYAEFGNRLHPIMSEFSRNDNGNAGNDDGTPLLVQVRNIARLRHLARRTEMAYVGWIERLVRFEPNMGDGSIPTKCPANMSISS
jgi:hypothetical protein